MTFAELQAEMNIYNLCYWYFHRDDILRAGQGLETLPDGRRAYMPVDTIAKTRPEEKGEEDGK